MAEFFEYDPLTGITYEWEHNDETGESTIIAKQDLQKAKDYCTRMRNLGAVDKGIKEDWWQYAIIPPIIQLEMMNKGIDMRDSKAIYDEININYPAFKLTDKSHNVKGEG